MFTTQASAEAGGCRRLTVFRHPAEICAVIGASQDIGLLRMPGGLDGSASIDKEFQQIFFGGPSFKTIGGNTLHLRTTHVPEQHLPVVNKCSNGAAHYW